MRSSEFINEYKARGKVSGKGPISIGNLYKYDMPVINTPISKYLEVRVDNEKEEYPEYFFYDKATGECVGNFALNALSYSAEDAKAIIKPGVLIVQPHITLAPALQGKGIGTKIYRTFLADGDRVFATHMHSAAAGALWDKVAKGNIISVLFDPVTGKIVDSNSKESRRAVRILGHKSKFNPEAQLEEGWKDTLGNIAAAGAIAAGGTAGIAGKQAIDNYLDKAPTSAISQAVKQVDAKPKINTQTIQAKQQKAASAEKPAEKPAVAKKAEVPTLSGNPLEKVLLTVAQQEGINGAELAAFMAQMAHESENFKDMVEDYPDVKRYGTGKLAKILGNKNMNDAKRFIGRGFIQLTGRWNYKWMERELGIDLTSTWSAAQKAADPTIAAKIAIIFWKKRVRPNVDNFHDVVDVTKYINPGLRGLKHRKAKFNAYISAANIPQQDKEA